MNVRALVGSGDKIGRLALPFLLVGVVANVLRPAWFSVGGPATTLTIASIAVLIPGVIGWAWSAGLILTKVPKGELITSGPFSLVKHPLYTDVSLLVLPWAGFLFNSWLGVVLGLVIYLGSRLYAPAEEAALAQRFGAEWDEYCDCVKLPWL